MGTPSKIDNFSKNISSSISTNSHIGTSASENTLKVGESSIERIKDLHEYSIKVCSDAEITIDSCLKKIEKYEADVAKLNKDSKMLQEGINKCKDEITKRGQLINKQNAEIKKLKDDLTLSNSQKSELEKQLKDSETLSEKTAKELKDKISQLTTEIQTLNNQIDIKGKEVSSITQERDVMKQKLAYSEQELKKTKQKLESVEEQLQSSQKEFQEINEYIAKMHSGAKRLSDKVNDAQKLLEEKEIKPVEIEEGLLDLNFNDI